MLLERKRKKDINKMTIVTIFVLILISFFSEKMESIKVVLYVACALVGFFSTRYTFVIIMMAYTNAFSLFNGLEMQGGLTDFGLIAGLVCCGMETIRYIKEKKYKISKTCIGIVAYVLCVLLLLSFSIMVAKLRYDQPIIRGIYSFRYILVIMYVFPFIRFLKKDRQEKIVIMEYLSRIITISIIIIIIQELIKDKVEILKLLRTSRLGKDRILLHAASPLYIMVFAYNLYKILKDKKDVLYGILPIILILIAVFIISQTRIFMACILSVAILEVLIFSKIKIANKIALAIIGFCIIGIAFETNIVNQMLGNLFEDVNKDGDSYIRNEGRRYYMALIDDEFFFMGGGITNEKYLESPINAASEYNYDLVDIGIYGFFFEYGSLGIIAIGILTIDIFRKSFYIKDKSISNLLKMFCAMIITMLYTVSPLSSSVWILYVVMIAFIESEINLNCFEKIDRK